jgi:HSP20 family protein
MTLVRFNHRNCMPAQPDYRNSNDLMRWFWNDYEPGFINRPVPLANILETGQDFRIELSVPGFSKNDIRINLEGQILKVSGEAQNTPDNQDERYIRREFSRQAFSRSFRLSNWVDASGINAKYENGTLLLTIPKTEDAKLKASKEIVIE